MWLSTSDRKESCNNNITNRNQQYWNITKYQNSIIQKNLTILPEYNQRTVNVYNGKIFITLEINDKMIGFKFGEFISTRKKTFSFNQFVHMIKNYKKLNPIKVKVWY